MTEKLTDKEVKLLTYIQELFSKPVFLVGGAVRDIEMGRTPKDYDFCTALTPDEIKAEIKGIHKAYLVGERHGTIGFKLDGEMMEITTYRTETYNKGSRQPNVEFVDDLFLDLSRRDLTINAMAINCGTFELYDPFGGKEDISNGIIRSVGTAEDRIKEDPLRILRAVRISMKYGFDIQSDLEKAIITYNHLLLSLSKERIMDEFKYIMKLESLKELSLLWTLELFKYTIPELSLQLIQEYYTKSRFSESLYIHTCKLVTSIPHEYPELRWAALFLKIGYAIDPVVGNDVLFSIDTVKKYSLHLKWSNKMTDAIIDALRTINDSDSKLQSYISEVD